MSRPASLKLFAIKLLLFTPSLHRHSPPIGNRLPSIACDGISSQQSCVSHQAKPVYHHGKTVHNPSPHPLPFFFLFIIYMKIPTVFVRIITRRAKKTPLKLVEKSTSLKKAPNPPSFLVNTPPPSFIAGLTHFRILSQK